VKIFLPHQSTVQYISHQLLGAFQLWVHITLRCIGAFFRIQAYFFVGERGKKFPSLFVSQFIYRLACMHCCLYHCMPSIGFWG